MKPLRTPAELVAANLVPPERLAALEQVAARYAVSLTPDVIDLIHSDDPVSRDPASRDLVSHDPSDPIARQFVPDPRELVVQPQEHADPIGDDAHSPVEGIVHRYPDRVLLKLVHICPVYCRFCFRRESVGPGHRRWLSRAMLVRALDYIRAHPQIWEVILTGGDPLVLSPRRLREAVRALESIEHVKIVRVHTRVPVVAPARITAEVVRAIKARGKTTYVVLHANHPRELSARARVACARIVDAGIPMLSQSVLLRGVNDDPDTLAALMRALVESRIKPYYLHHGDLAPGTSHLRTTIPEGQGLIRALHGRLSGLCQPTYVLDIPGGHGKSPIGPSYVERVAGAGESAGFEIEDFNGIRHSYPAARQDDS